MELAELQRNWDAFGRTDPLWAILTDPAKRHGGWDVGEFFASGRAEVAAALRRVEALGASPRRGRALDFGCGVGRLTQALAEHFDEVVGVDIAPSMVAQARWYNRHGDRCRYVVNGADDLAIFPDGHFDFLYTFVVLQHMHPRYIRRYIAEFLRVLAPGGVACFQVPGEWREIANEPLPASSWRARLTLADPPGSLPAGSEAVVRVGVENLADEPWPTFGMAAARHPIRVGNHWLDEEGRRVVHDDGRAFLPPGELAPGDHVDLPLEVRAPEAPGRYVLEVDLVQEGVSWFVDRGSESARAPVRIRRRSPLAEPARAALRRLRRRGPRPAVEPRMEMYVLPEPEVRRIVADNGGRLVDVREWRGGDYTHYSYCATK